MDFVALKEGAARDIALAFGVPPVLVGLPGDATYANAREAGRALYRQTILPMAGRLLNALGAMLSDWMGPVKLAVDTDQISELAAGPAAVHERRKLRHHYDRSFGRWGRCRGARTSARAD
jgi:phage portal protein BeeE